MRRKWIALTVLVAAATLRYAVAAPVDASAVWIEEFAALRAHMAAHYANLDWMVDWSTIPSIALTAYSGGLVMARRISSISILVAAGLLACASNVATDSLASGGSASDNGDSTAADGVDAYKKTLQLRLHISPVEVAVGETFEVELTITNTSKSFIAACVGPSGGYTVEVGGKKQFGDSFVSHPTCDEEFYLQAGESTKLVRRYEVPPVDHGKARVIARLEILDPTTCTPMGGCLGVTIESQTAGGLIVLPSAAPPTDP